MALTASTAHVYPEYRDLSIVVDQGIARLVLERPDTRNVISDEPLVTELANACRALNLDRDVRVVVLTGRGSAFSAGGNIRQMHDKAGIFAGAAHEIADNYRRGIQALIQAVYAIEVPTIAAVNGPAIGAGFDLSLACDLRLASSTARFGETFVNLGLVPGDGGSWLLPRVVGVQRAFELSFTGRVFGAEEARALGVVLSVHDPSELLGAASELAQTIASKPAAAVRYTKQLLRRSGALTFDALLESTAGIQAMMHGTVEHSVALAAALRPRA